MEKISKFVECLLPITICNLRCHYCYVIQRHNRLMQKSVFNYPVNRMIKALTKERMGGVTFFSICGAGETLLCQELPELVKGLLANGHYVNLTTNGTISKTVDDIILSIPKEDLQRLQFAFSYHHLELLRVNKQKLFFENVKKVRDAGCSFLVQVNHCDEYIPYTNDILNIVKSNTGAYPQLAATRKEENLKSDIRLYTKLSKDEYIQAGIPYKSPLFNFTIENFNRKQNEYCYAGEWSYVLNLGTGILQACYSSLQRQNIFKNDNPIKFHAIGKHCCSFFCMNSSHFMSMGVIPSVVTPSYCELRNRETKAGEWYNPIMKSALSCQFKELHHLYSSEQKFISEIRYYYEVLLNNAYQLMPNSLKNVYRKCLKH